MKRPILIAVIGYITGILMGLYFKFSIVPFYILLIPIFFIIKINYRDKKVKNKLRILSIKRYIRYLKLFISKEVIVVFIISSIISNINVLYKKNKYESLYKNKENINLVAVVISEKQEKEYKDIYKIKITNPDKYKNTNLYLKVNKKSNINLKYGDKIKLEGEFEEFSEQRNTGCFNQKEYGNIINVYGNITANSITILNGNSGKSFSKIVNNLKLKIKKNLYQIMDKELASVAEGILLGDTYNMEESLKEDFRISSMSHILAVSGMHISYIIIGINLIFKKFLGKLKTRYFILIILIFYMFLTSFTPSVVRASIMSILIILSYNLHMKNDIWNSLCISLILILVYNPFLILHTGLQLSYLGTIGILILYPNTKLFITNLLKFLRRNPIFYKKIERVVDKIVDLISVTISAQMFILPILFMKFNIFGPYFLISNLLSSFIIAPIIILGIILIIISLVYLPISKIISLPLKLLIQFLIQITNLSNFPFAKIYVPTPKLWQILLYMLILLLLNFIFYIYNSKSLNQTQRRIKNLIALMKYRYMLNKKRNRKIVVLIIVSLVCIINIPTSKMSINFVDVGQGDCTFIITPKNKTILIDGGGSKSNSFDVGKSTLIPYILNKGYTKIDYIVISHYDQDHVRADC